jgi:hypothetical protein
VSFPPERKLRLMGLAFCSSAAVARMFGETLRIPRADDFVVGFIACIAPS